MAISVKLRPLQRRTPTSACCGRRPKVQPGSKTRCSICASFAHARTAWSTDEAPALTASTQVAASLFSFHRQDKCHPTHHRATVPLGCQRHQANLPNPAGGRSPAL